MQLLWYEPSGQSVNFHKVESSNFGMSEILLVFCDWIFMWLLRRIYIDGIDGSVYHFFNVHAIFYFNKFLMFIQHFILTNVIFKQSFIQTIRNKKKP